MPRWQHILTNYNGQSSSNHESLKCLYTAKSFYITDQKHMKITHTYLKTRKFHCQSEKHLIVIYTSIICLSSRLPVYKWTNAMFVHCPKNTWKQLRPRSIRHEVPSPHTGCMAERAASGAESLHVRYCWWLNVTYFVTFWCKRLCGAKCYICWWMILSIWVLQWVSC